MIGLSILRTGAGTPVARRRRNRLTNTNAIKPARRPRVPRAEDTKGPEKRRAKGNPGYRDTGEPASVIATAANVIAAPATKAI